MAKIKKRLVRAVDLFAGAGGASTGLARACQDLGYDLDLLAINHWPVAVDTHTKNHPQVRHLCESVEQIDPREVVPGGRLDILLAGPECTHFSTARGGRPVNPQYRASAWHILKWAQELYIETILIENVPEFRTWGPIGANHKPLKSKRGETYQAFLNTLRSLGYRVQDALLNAADYGDPTTRKRLFIQACRGHHQINWPVRTHSKTASTDLFSQRQRYASARDHVIDWSVEGKSIFNRKKPLKPATIARIIAGLKKFGGPELQPFIIAMEHGGRVCDIDQPLPTITTAKGGAFGVAQPFLVQFKGTAESQIPHTAQDIDEPVGTLTGSGADFGVAEPFLLHTTHGGRINDVDDPIPTVTGARRGEIGIVEPFVLQQQSGGVPRSVEDPVPTIATGGAISLIEPFVISAGGPDCPARSVKEPLGTVLTRDHRAVVQPFLSKYYGNGDGACPVSEPTPTVTTKDRFGLVEPFLLPPRYQGKDERVTSIEEPLPTVAAASGRCFGLVQPVINGYKLDIHFRMLQPHELARAMSFPKDYIFSGTREDVVKQIGNAWAGELSKALCMSVLLANVKSKKKVGKAA